MEMHQVRYFLAVARTLNFTQAADECHVAQPSLSRAVIKLEEELGGDLFRRERGLTHLTELGRMMLPLLSQCFESAAAAKQLAASYKKGACAPLRLALSHTVNMQLLIQPLTELVKAFPGLELDFNRGIASRVGELLKTGEAEIGVACPIPDPWDRLESWPLFSERFELVANPAHPLAMRNTLSLDQIGGARLLPRAYCEQAGDLEAILARRGLHQSFQDHIGSDHDLMSLLSANVGVAIMPRSARTAGELRFLPIADLDLARPFVLYAVAGRQRSPAANGLIRLLRAANWPKILDVDQAAAPPSAPPGAAVTSAEARPH